MLRELVMANRSYRRFYQNENISTDTLRNLVELARYSASGANLQPLKFVLVNKPELNQKVFSRLGWAAALKNWPGPEEGERPAAYVIILRDHSIDRGFLKDDIVDHAIAAQSMLLGAVEKGLGGCMIGMVNRKGLSKDLDLDEKYEILLVVALGKPKETVQIDDLEPGAGANYWRDENMVHHVPKRTLGELILAEHE